MAAFLLNSCCEPQDVQTKELNATANAVPNWHNAALPWVQVETPELEVGILSVIVTNDLRSYN